jgi:uncharacterized protein
MGNKNDQIRKEEKMRTINTIAASLLVIGGLNWGLVGLFNFDLVSSILGNMTGFSRAIYSVVGICAMYLALAWTLLPGRGVVHSKI